MRCTVWIFIHPPLFCLHSRRDGRAFSIRGSALQTGVPGGRQAHISTLMGGVLVRLQEHWSGVRDSNPFVQLGRLVHNLYANPAFARYPHSTGPRHCQSEDWRDFWSGRWESNPRRKLGKLPYFHYTTSAFWCPAEESNLCFSRVIAAL